MPNIVLKNEPMLSAIVNGASPEVDYLFSEVFFKKFEN
jgi:hypothetical protein